MRSMLFLLLGFSLTPWGVAAQSLEDLYRRVLPSVVKVESNEAIRLPRRGRVELGEGVGAGVLIDTSGLILTAAHVVQTSDQIAVSFSDGRRLPAKVLYSVPSADVALLKTVYPPKDKRAVRLADSDSVRIGSPVFLIGSPRGTAFSLSSGIVSGRHVKRRFTNGLSAVEYLQTDASINPGSSGGPMFNYEGEVVGIASYILSNSGGFEGMGFAATANVCRRLLLEQKSHWTGVEGILLEGRMAELLNVPGGAGLLVQKVASLSPADLLGLHGGDTPAEINGESLLLGGDIILEVNGVSFAEERSIEKIMAVVKSGKLMLKVLRSGEQITISGSR